MTIANPLLAPVSRTPITEGWTVRAASGPAEVGRQPLPATVPGVVHLDLMAAGLIPDPYLDDNESKLAWIGLVDWTFETEVTVTAETLAAGERHELVFDGLDTVATVLLNGERILEVANQHRKHRVDITDRLHAGDNRLTVEFRSPVRYANAQSVALGARPRPYPFPYDAIRKSACSFGWDWGIATYSSGIWRPVRLETWSGARLGDVLMAAEPHGAGGTVRVRADVVRTGGELPLTVTVSVAGESATVEVDDESGVDIEVRIPQVERWWPAGHGAQPLYDVSVRLSADASLLDETTRRVGFRTVRWNTAPDEAGTPFELIVNDRSIFVKGVNWIPDDAFPSRVDRARYRRRLEQATQAHINLIRVWGGGIYEADDFYDLCDELGLLTWQDFLFACAAYSEDEPLRSEVQAEARDNVTRIAHHASLVLLTGNNENLWGYEDWGWKARLDGKSWGEHYYYELLPAIVAEIAPHVSYAPGSPFSPGGEHPNAERHGTMHLWEQWNRLDWTTYRAQTPRFVAEFGWQGPPTWSTLTQAIHDQPLTPESPGMIVHQKAIDGNAKLSSGLVPHYRVPEEMEMWHWAMQLNQANAVSAALEWFRSHAPHTSGAVVWQLNDCWPVTSWAAIDGGGREKPLFYALRNAFAPRVVTVLPVAGELTVTLVNDTDESWSGDLELRRRDFSGRIMAGDSRHVVVGPRATVRVAVDGAVAEPRDAARELLTAEALGQRGFWWFSEPRDSALPSPEFSLAVSHTDEETFDVEVTAGTILRDLAILVDKIAPSATVDEGLRTLLPGEVATFRISGVAAIAENELREPGILRSANELVAGA
ncbi:glycoside hydrolase family 2 protein [Microbacterium invictum]|uniref:beta-mannosidase n=1 Tax=Microbacterium invictum TaxID=515415 RepID=A0ABZ0VC57_9MICO|nr:glycoside hydrolase family 2 protein [Microbacterium invictum]WQB70714.1 glycoside hydrolase family 2 protein [Microbacterium invictum]